MKSSACELFSQSRKNKTRVRNGSRLVTVEILLFFLRLSSSSRDVSSFRRRSKEDFLPRKYTRVLFLSVERDHHHHSPARDLRRYFLFSLSTTTAHTRETRQIKTALSVSARESTSRGRERERLIAQHTHNTHIFFLLSAVTKETN